jgi:hypothetical protein
MKAASGMLWGAATLAVVGVVLATSGLTIAVLTSFHPANGIVVSTARGGQPVDTDWSRLGLAVMMACLAFVHIAQIIVRRPFGAKSTLMQGPTPQKSLVAAFAILAAVLVGFQLTTMWSAVDRAWLSESQWASPASALESIGIGCGTISIMCCVVSNLAFVRWWRETQERLPCPLLDAV